MTNVISAVQIVAFDISGQDVGRSQALCFAEISSQHNSDAYPRAHIGLFDCGALEFFRTFSGKLDLNVWTAREGKMEELIEEDRTLTFPVR